MGRHIPLPQQRPAAAAVSAGVRRARLHGGAILLPGPGRRRRRCCARVLRPRRTFLLLHHLKLEVLKRGGSQEMRLGFCLFFFLGPSEDLMVGGVEWENRVLLHVLSFRLQ